MFIYCKFLGVIILHTFSMLHVHSTWINKVLKNVLKMKKTSVGQVGQVSKELLKKKALEN